MCVICDYGYPFCPEYNSFLSNLINEYLKEIKENILKYRTLNHMLGDGSRTRYFELRLLDTNNIKQIVTFRWIHARLPSNPQDGYINSKIHDIYDFYVLDDSYIDGKYSGSKIMIESKDIIINGLTFEDVLNSIFPIETTTILRFTD